MKTCALMPLCVAAVAAPALAAPTFVASLGDQLIVRNGALQSQYTMADDITAMAVGPDGKIYATSPSDDGNGTYELYTIENVTSSPTLNLLGDFLSENTPTLSFIGNTLYGVQYLPGNTPSSRLITIDIGAQSETVVGSDGYLVDLVAGSGYDPLSDTFYNLAKIPGPSGSLYTVDYTTPSASLVGSLVQRTNNLGAEFYNGVLYAAMEDVDPSLSGTFQLNLGTVNTATGEVTFFANLLSQYDVMGGNFAVGLAVLPGIPAPGAASAFALVGLGALRRRRR